MAMIDAAAIGRRIRRARFLAGNLTQADLSKRSGVSIRTIQSWEAGRSAPRARNLEQLAVALGVPVEELIGRTGDDGLTTIAQDILDELRRSRVALDRLCDLAARAARNDESPGTKPGQ